MEKVLRKFDKVAARRKDDVPNIMNRIETDDGGLSVDGWCAYLESDDHCDIGMYALFFATSPDKFLVQRNPSPRPSCWQYATARQILSKTKV